ncbi:hypothetical protein RB195_026199 [Necator americanus]|uniref:PDZ domain-containing protein n=1 Tax=Necator americanus TaxID=51031 RepID=A0ABR1EVV5_NECAM
MPTVKESLQRTFHCSSRVFFTWIAVSVSCCTIYAIIAFVALLNKNALPEDLGLLSIPYVNVPERYDIQLQFDTEYNKSSKSFYGENKIVFNSLRESKYIHLYSGNNIQIADFSLHSLNNAKEELSIRKGAYDEVTEIQTFILSTNTSTEVPYLFILKFTGKFTPENGPRKFSYLSERGDKRYGVWYAVDNSAGKGLRYLFPCLDSKEFPADFNLTITRSKSLRSLSNFVSYRSTSRESDFMDDHFAPTMKLLPSQIAFVLCDFQYKREVYEGTTISIFSRPEILSGISFRRTSQFMDSGSYEIGKNDAILIPNVSTIHQPGISIIDEKEAVRESEDLFPDSSLTRIHRAMSRRPPSPLLKSENFRYPTQLHTQHQHETTQVSTIVPFTAIHAIRACCLQSYVVYYKGEIAPQDSDTDSGICADSEQPSPRQLIEIPLIFSSNCGSDYLTPESYRKPLLFSETSRKLPQRPTGSGSVARNIKTYRVRFADEVNSGASTSSTCSEQSNKSTRCATAVPQRQQPNLDIPETPAPHFSNIARGNNACLTPQSQTFENQLEKYKGVRKTDRLGNYSYPIEEVDTLRPPSYDFAINRLRRKEKPRESIRDFVIRQNVNEALSRKLRSRSSSLPRMDREYDINESFYSPQLPPSYQIDDSRNLTLRSLDNLNIDCDSHIVDSSRRRKLPVAPLLGRMVNARINRQFDPDFGLHSTLLHRPSEEHLALQRMSRRSASIGPQCEILDYGTRREAPAVRAVLVALDQCGFRTVMVEKTQPGPFGFYIATGVMNGQRGIFISRVSIASLSPMLSVGDEILYVDDQLVKGRSLETVQALIAGKTKVMIVLLPAIGSCI